MSEGDEILLGREGGLATLVIKRPQALNALTLANYRRFAPALADWAADPSVHAVAVRGAGERAFCAGGDVRAVYEAGRGISGDPELPAVFFREEYELIRKIHRFPKPYVAVIDGITMGGGAGISVNGGCRIATERTLFAMPETAIGLFPDVGATRFLNRCPGHVGRYLGLSGARLGAADVIPFIPIEGATLEDCVAIARRAGEEIWKRYQVPVYLYEAAAQRPERQNLENVRRGQFEGIREEVKTNPDRKPDSSARFFSSFGLRRLRRACGTMIEDRYATVVHAKTGFLEAGRPRAWSRRRRCDR